MKQRELFDHALSNTITVPRTLKKYVDGKVCVLLTSDYGTGWYSNHLIPELLFDPTVVEMVLDGADPRKIFEYCENAYEGWERDYWGAYSLEVEYVEENTPFLISDYDGLETLQTYESHRWIVA